MPMRRRRRGLPCCIRVFDSISTLPLVKVALAAAGAVAALLLPAYVGAFLAPGAGRLTVLAGNGSTSTISPTALHQTLHHDLCSRGCQPRRGERQAEGCAGGQPRVYAGRRTLLLLQRYRNSIIRGGKLSRCVSVVPVCRSGKMPTPPAFRF